MPANILFFGFDGLEPTVVDTLIGAGDLPHFKALRARAETRPVTPYPALGAGPFWTSAATGLTPGEHGRYFYIVHDPETYEIKPFHEQGYPAPAFWKRYDDMGRKSAIIDWHRAPLDEMRHGYVVDEWLGHDSFTGVRASPPETIDRLKPYGLDDPLGAPLDGAGADARRAWRAFLDGAFDRIRRKKQFCVSELEAADWDFFAPCFSELHDIGHYFFHIEDSAHPRYDPTLAREFGSPLRDAYKALDDAVGA
ncbi:MAG: alkaline phosphatase family protein, partial [Hyphococcus sp.]